MVPSRVVPLLVVVLLSLDAPIAAAAYSTLGNPEPDTRLDVEGGFGYLAPDVSDARSRVYFNGFLTAQVPAAGASPGVAVGASQAETAVDPVAYTVNLLLGVWKDCNRDGFVGDGDQGLWEYRSEILDAEATEKGFRVPASCRASPPPTTLAGIASWHNDGQWVREYVPIAWAAPDTPLDRSIVVDNGSRAWYDHEYPTDPLAPDCPAAPPSDALGGLVQAECGLKRRSAGVLSPTAGLGIATRPKGLWQDPTVWTTASAMRHLAYYGVLSQTAIDAYGLDAPGRKGLYQSDRCADFAATDGTNGVDCDAQRWWRDSSGGADVSYRSPLLGHEPGAAPPCDATSRAPSTSAATRGCESVSPRPGDRYDLRDTDCVDDTVGVARRAAHERGPPAAKDAYATCDDPYQVDPSNEDLPALDPVNRRYLDEGRADGTIAETGPTVDAQAAAGLVASAIGLANDTLRAGLAAAEPLRPDGVASAIAPIARAAIQTIRSAPSTARGVRHLAPATLDATDGAIATCDLRVTPARADLSPAFDLASCLRSEAQRALPRDAVPIPQAALAPPGVAPPALAEVPTLLSIDAGLRETPLRAPLGGLVDLDLSDGGWLGREASAAASVLPTPPAPVNLDPKNLADGLGVAYDLLVGSAPVPARQKETAVSLADSLFYNVYVANADASRAWTFMDVAIGNATRIDVDGDASTGVQGADLVVTATLAPAGDAAPPTNASRATPTLRVRSLSPATQTRPLLVCAFTQLPGVPFVAATCLDTRSAGGFLDSGSVTLRAYAFDAADANVSASLRVEASSARPTPLVAAGSVFRVDETARAKPRIDHGDHADAALRNDAGQGNAELSVQRTRDTAGGASALWTWTADGVRDLFGSYDLQRGERAFTASSAARGSPRVVGVRVLRDATDAILDASATRVADAAAGATTFAWSDAIGSAPAERASFDARSLPAAWSVHADDATGDLVLATQGGAPDGVSLVHASRRDGCPSTAVANEIVRDPATLDRGACLLVRLDAPIEDLRATLSADAPHVALAGRIAAAAPLAIALRPTAQGRSLEALFSGIPTSASLDGVLARGSDRSTLAWACSERLDEVRVRIRSGPALLAWDATRAPVAATFAIDWATDQVALRTTGEATGSIRLALSDSGRVPALAAEDHVVAVRDAGGFGASLALTGAAELTADLATEDVRVREGGGASGPFGLRYSRAGGPTFTLDAALPAPGGFTLETRAQQGTYRVDQSRAGRGGNLEWIGNVGSAHVEGRIDDAPAAWSLTASPGAGTLAVDAGGDLAGRARVLRAGTAASLATLPGQDVVDLQADVLLIDLEDVASLAVAATEGSLAVSSAQSRPHPLHLHVGDASAFTRLDASPLPPSLRIARSRTGLAYAASASVPPDVDLAAVGPGQRLTFEGRGLPATASLEWASTPTTWNATVAHDGAASVPRLAIASATTPASGSASEPGEFVKIAIDDAPGRVLASFDDAREEIAVGASPTPAGIITIQHAASASAFDVPADVDHLVRASRSDGGASVHAVRLRNVRSARLADGGRAGGSQTLELDAPSASPLYARSSLDGRATFLARLSNAPGPTRVSVDLAAASDGTNLTGLKIEHASAGTIGAMDLHAETGQRELDVSARSAPRAWSAAWASSRPIEVRADGSIALDRLAYRPLGEAPAIVPGADEYLLLDASQPTQPRIGLAFPAGVRLARVDLAANAYAVFAATAARRAIDARGESSAFRLDARGAPARQSLWVQDGPPTQLTWLANGPTGELAWALDAPHAVWRWNATDQPAVTTVRLDPALGSFELGSTQAAGDTFRVQYVDDPREPARGDGPGLVLLVKPSGPEGYAPHATSFALDVPQARRVSATFTGADANARTLQPYGIALERQDGASPAALVFVTAAGPETLALATSNVAAQLRTTWTASATTGFHGEVWTDSVLASTRATLRTKDAIGDLQVAAIAGAMLLHVDAAGDGGATVRVATLDYANGEASPTVRLSVDAAGVLAALDLNGAPREIRVRAPLQCGSVGAEGRAFVPDGASATRARLVLAPRDAPALPLVAEPTKVALTCDAQAATVQLDLPGFRDAAWRIDPRSDAIALHVRAEECASGPAHLLARAAGGRDALDAILATLPATIDLASASANGAMALDARTDATTTMHVIAIAPQSSLRANVTEAPTQWSLVADASHATPLLYEGSGPASALLADAATRDFGAHVDADDVPATIAWDVPVTACPPATGRLDASVSTRGTGSVGRLAYVTLPRGSGELADGDGAEHAILACDENGARSSANVTGVASMAWTRAPASLVAPSALAVAAPGGVERALGVLAALLGPARASASAPPAPTPAGAKGIHVERDATKADPNAALALRLDDLDGTPTNATIQPPVASVGYDVVSTAGRASVTETNAGATPASMFVEYDQSPQPILAAFARPAARATESLDATGPDLVYRHDAAAASPRAYFAAPASGPTLVVAMSGGVPPTVRGVVAACAPGSAGVAFTTSGTGTVGRFAATITTGSSPPAPATGRGAALSCGAQGLPELGADVAGMAQMALPVDPCATTLVMPVDSLAESDVPLDTPWARADVRLRLAPPSTGAPDAAILDLTISDDAIRLRARDASGSGAVDPTLATIRASYERVANATTGAGAVPCLALGGSIVRALDVEAHGIDAVFDAVLGRDEDGRTRIALAGGHAHDVALGVQVEPTTTAPTQDASDARTRLHVAADLAVAGALVLKYNTTTAAPPAPPSADASGNYAILARGQGLDGANVRLVGFTSASLTLDERRLADRNWTRARIAYASSAEGQPLAIVVSDPGQGRMDVHASALPTSVAGTIDLFHEDAGGLRADVAYDASARPTVSVASYQDAALRWRASLADLPDHVDGSFSFANDANGDLAGTVRYASGDTGASAELVYIGDAKDTYVVDVDALPRALEGAFAYTSCGISFDASLGDPVGRIGFVRVPGGDGSAQERARATPGCPTSSGASAPSGRAEPGVSLDATLHDVPAGALALDLRTGSAGGGVVTSGGGAIGSVSANVTREGGASPFTLSLSAKNAMIHSANWDFDGETRYNGKPKTLYLDTGGVFVDDLRLRYDGVQGCDNAAASVTIKPGAPVMFHEYQIQITNPGVGDSTCGKLGFSVPHIARNGSVCYGDSRLTPLHVQFDKSGFGGFAARNFVSFDVEQPYPTPAECPFQTRNHLSGQ